MINTDQLPSIITVVVGVESLFSHEVGGGGFDFEDQAIQL